MTVLSETGYLLTGVGMTARSHYAALGARQNQPILALQALPRCGPSAYSISYNRLYVLNRISGRPALALSAAQISL